MTRYVQESERLRTENAQLQEQLAEARKDTERLDAYEKMARNGDDKPETLYTAEGEILGWQLIGWKSSGNLYDTFREAIDARGEGK